LIAFSPNGKYLADEAPGGELAVMTVSGVQYSAEENFAGRRIRPIGPTSPIIEASSHLTLAIVDLESPTGKQVGRTVAEMLRNAIVNAKVRVVAYDRMQEIIKQQNFEQSVRTDPTTAVALGTILNATEMLFGSVSLIGSTYLITVHLVDVETAAEKGAREVQCDRCTDDDLPGVVAELRAITIGPQ
jgi:hypothetical protein